MLSEGCVVVTEALLAAVEARSADAPLHKKARNESGANHPQPETSESLVLKALTRDALEAALHSRGGGAFSVAEVAGSHPGVARTFVLRSESSDARLPANFTLDGLTIPVFAAQQLRTSPRVVAPYLEHQRQCLTRPVLLVGAGGIGCELLKVLVLSGFKHIEVIDLDTIDATNLNRQFLFCAADVGASKAVTARAAVLRWFDVRRQQYPKFSETAWAAPPTIVAYHDNVKDEEKFNDAFFARFAAVLNALDNVSARQHVNRMCMKVNVPLFESGTMGYNGQVQPILKGHCECYDCHPKPADQKTFAVCTIHARPTTMVHCVHFAKELYEALCGERSMLVACRRGETADADADAADGDAAASASPSSATGGELGYLKRLVDHWCRERAGKTDDLQCSSSLLAMGVALLRCLFHEKIEELLAMKSSWATEPPVPLNMAVVDDVVEREGLPSAARVSKVPRDTTPTVDDDIRMFLFSAGECVRRVIAPTNARDVAFPFRKEDDLAVMFVATTANLRAGNFHIAQASVEELRTVAGAIVPAIATTNAMVAAGVVQQLLHYSLTTVSKGPCLSPTTPLAGTLATPSLLSMVYVRRTPLVKRRRLHTTPLLYGHGNADSSLDQERPASLKLAADRYLMYSVAANPPNPSCPVCTSHEPPTVRVTVSDLNAKTLGAFVQDVLEDALGFEGPSVTSGARIVYEADDYEELAGRPLGSFGGGEVTFLVDALNKEMEWRVTVSKAEPLQQSSEEGDGGFVVSGLEAARSAEAAALAARAEAEAAAARNEGEARGGVEVDVLPPETVHGMSAGDAIDLDVDDNDDVSVVSDAGPASTAADDVVVEID